VIGGRRRASCETARSDYKPVIRSPLDNVRAIFFERGLHTDASVGETGAVAINTQISIASEDHRDPQTLPLVGQPKVEKK
jgi:hypothetical protein